MSRDFDVLFLFLFFFLHELQPNHVNLFNSVPFFFKDPATQSQDFQFGLLSAWSFACSPMLMQVFPPTAQKSRL